MDAGFMYLLPDTVDEQYFWLKKVYFSSQIFNFLKRNKFYDIITKLSLKIKCFSFNRVLY